MYNHFASLLANIDLVYTAPMQETYLLSDEFSDFITTAGDDYIVLEDYFTTIKSAKNPSVLINRDFLKLDLPTPLKKFYDILFPQTSSDYYKQFLLYCYLRIVSASDKNEDVKKHDKRITYVLDEMVDYFRFTKVSVPKSNTADYRLLVFGSLSPSEDIKYFLNNFIVKQVDHSQGVLVFSSTQLKYYKQGKAPSSSPDNMVTEFNADHNTSDTIIIGDTGLSFKIAGPFTSTDPTQLFSYSGNKLWTFMAECPFIFNIQSILNDLNSHHQIVDEMLEFGKIHAEPSYDNIWKGHYNDVYRLAGLILAYVERVNLVWESIAM